MDINIYTKGFSADLIPKIKKRFADFHMDIEFHPEFKFDEQTDTGFLPIKLKVRPGHSKQYDNIDYEIMTGFELLFSDFNFDEELKNAQQQAAPTESKSFLSKLFGGSKSVNQTEETFVADKDLDKLLKLCKKDVMLNWKSWNKSELRISLFFAAILAELTDGVIYDPQNGRYLNGQQALHTFPLEIDDYEQSFVTDEFMVDKFEGWV
ncbi:hypothetical protein [Pedobacter aquatilis]|uniref:hypothetical protein n=1 Tax=Pedobacter aquatilis TaxID=351343 RepID=UPI0025B600F7|nr:hypothetical protein [Pedobacter aquatilis]